MRLKRAFGGVLVSGLTLLTAACVVEDDTKPKAEPENKTQIEIKTEEPGPFERVGARMDRGAKKLDKEMEKGAEKLGRAMQKAGEEIQENAQEAQARRAREEAARNAAPKVDVDINVEQPKP